MSGGERKMSNVDVTKIKEPFFRIILPQPEMAEDIGVNLSKIYEYIHRNKKVGCFPPYGNAYRLIRKRATELISRGDVKVSKKEVKALINPDRTLLWELRIKVPFKLHYIFKAIFEIVNELQEKHPLPEDLVPCIGRINRECFYNEQSILYRECYDDIREVPEFYDDQNYAELVQALYSDIFAGDSILSDKFLES